MDQSSQKEREVLPAIASSDRAWGQLASLQAGVTKLLSSKEGALVVLCAVALGFGSWLRIQNLEFPAGFGLDEGEFFNNAKNLFEGRPDANDHPPLGKLIVSWTMGVFGTHVWVGRLAQVVFGVALLPLTFLLGWRGFLDWRAGLVAAALVACDGPFVVYSRMGLVDGFLFTFAAAGLACALTERRALWVAAGFFAGLAGSVKLSGFFICPAIAVALFQRAAGVRVALAWGSLSAAAAIVAYALAGALAGSAIGEPAPWLYAYTDTLSDLERHLGMTGRHHPMSSRFTSWYRPMRVISFDVIASAEGSVRMRSMVGNPLLWWAGWAAAGVSLVLAGQATLRRIWVRCRLPAGPTVADMGAESARFLHSFGLFGAGWLLLLLPWMFTSRDSYLYHYIPSHLMALVLVSGFGIKLFDRRPAVMLALLGVVFVISAFYAPVWASLELSFSELDQRMILWR